MKFELNWNIPISILLAHTRALGSGDFKVRNKRLQHISTLLTIILDVFQISIYLELAKV